MKTSVLLTAALTTLLLSEAAVAQRVDRSRIDLNGTQPVQRTTITSVPRLPNVTGAERVAPSDNAKLPLERKPQSSVLSLGTGDSVGFTLYDFQTNASMPDRIIRWQGEGGNNGIRTSMVWMAATDAATETRGTYGAVSDGSAWLPINFSGDWSTSKLDPTLRTGFCEVGRLSTGELVIINHTASTSSLSDGNPNLLKENGAASGQYEVLPLPNADGGLWPRMAVGGNDAIHVVYTFQNGTPNEGVLMYRRSTDKGASWTEPAPLTGASSVVLTDLRAVQGGDAYAMDANGDHVVIWYYTQGLQINQILSTDGGQTWTASAVLNPQQQRIYFSSPDDESQQMYPDLEYGADSAVAYRSDTALAPGSSMDVLVDADGTIRGVHAIMPSYVVRYHLNGGDTTQQGGTVGYIYQATFNYTDAGLLYYEQQGENVTRRLLEQPGNLTNEFENLDDRGNNGFSRWPQLGRNADGNLFLVFSSGIADDFITATSQLETAPKNYLYSHIFGMWTINGQEWSAPVNLTPNGVDAQYPSLADFVDGNLHIAYSADTYPGDWLTSSGTNTSTGAPTGSGLHNQIANAVQIMSIPQAQLGDIILSGVGTDRTTAVAGGSRIAAIAPNPALGAAQVTYSIANSGDYTIRLYNALGQEMATLLDNASLLVGTYTQSIDVSQLRAGSYVMVMSGNGATSAMSLNVVH